MTIMNQPENVEQQFSDDKNLKIRVDLYSKYSTNIQSFTSWLFDKYGFAENSSILELGCGNGSQWEGRLDQIPKGCTLVLSDISEGMVKAARIKNALSPQNVSFQRIDIQSIPFEAESFDFVIANHMLFHVPDLHKALTKAHRVLKPGGYFYSATDGNGGMRPFMNNVIRMFDPKSTAFSEIIPFSLQNGGGILSQYFSEVERIDYENELAITETQDLIEWLKSTTAISGYAELNPTEMYEYLESVRVMDGAINIPRETGLFVSIK